MTSHRWATGQEKECHYENARRPLHQGWDDQYAYWSAGSQGSPVILIHGIGGYIEAWLPNLDALVAQHQVYAVDLPGHGRTEKPLDESYAIASLAQFVKDFVAALGIEQDHVVGHSLGGAIATRLALMFPAVVDRPALVESRPRTHCKEYRQ